MVEKALKVFRDSSYLDAKLLIESDKQVFIQLLYEGFDSGKIEGQKLYYCLVTLHDLLDKMNVRLLCNGFRNDVRPSGMSLDMGHGVKAYKLVMGKKATELVDIFDSTDDLDAIGTVEDQKKFYQEWLATKRHQ